MRRLHSWTRRVLLALVVGLVLQGMGWSAELLIPMDQTQTDHLRAYGLTYWVLKQNQVAQWVLNYRGGSFLLPDTPEVRSKATAMSVRYEVNPDLALMNKRVEVENMHTVRLEKAPTVAIYTTPGNDPWDDAVTMALEYADIPFDKLWDPEVLQGKLKEYDWLHLHHEDFTGQYGKFYASFKDELWYKLQVKRSEEMAKQFNFPSVPEQKKAVARALRSYVENGGFLFAMCSATDTLDIALAAESTDIVPKELDGTPVDPGYLNKLDFTKTLAFQSFTIITDPRVYEHSSIDVSSTKNRGRSGAAFEDFQLFEFSAKFDPVPTMLNQCHVRMIPGFFGQTTSFNPETVKPGCVVLGKVPGTGRIKYIHGKRDKGTFTFLGGHDPEDPQHIVGDPPTDLNLHKNSPGYRLILNNILFPAAQRVERITQLDRGLTEE